LLKDPANRPIHFYSRSRYRPKDCRRELSVEAEPYRENPKAYTDLVGSVVISSHCMGAIDAITS
jgi:hypothetical protein